MSGPHHNHDARAVRRVGPLAAAMATLVMLATACAPPPAPPPPATGLNPDSVPEAGVDAYRDQGPYDVGVTTLMLSDRAVEVWYPADPTGIGATPKHVYYIRDNVPPAFDVLIPPAVNPPYETNAYRDVPASSDGPFPLSIFSHGSAGYRETSTELTTHLASWGFVVISPDYLERGLRNALGEPPALPRLDTVIADEAINAVKAASAAPGLLNSVVDGTSVFPFGHSAGGGTSLRLLQRPDVPSAVPMAAGISLSSIINSVNTPLPPGKSIFWIGARNDGIVSSENVRTGYEYTPGQKKILELGGAGHNNAFTEICEIGDGGVVSLAIAAGIPVPEFLLNLGNDGCPTPPFKDSAEVWPEVRHFLTAEMRYRSGLDPLPVGLGNQVVASFDDVIDYRHAP